MVKKNCEMCSKMFERYPSYFKNRSGRFCSRKCNLDFNSIEWKKDNPIKHIDNSGKNNPMYGKVAYNFNPNGSVRKDGYIRVSIKKRRVLLHRMIMENKLGRKLKSTEIVHHVDGDNTNNDISNLTVMTQSEHINLHRKDLQTGKVITHGDENQNTL